LSQRVDAVKDENLKLKSENQVQQQQQQQQILLKIGK